MTIRRLLVAPGCLLVFWGGWCFGQQNVLNGTLWKNLNLFERTLYVTGFNQGHAAGMRDGIKETLEAIKAVKPPSSWTLEERRELAGKADQIDQKSAANSDFTRGQLEATVSTFYGDYRNTPVCLDDAVWLSTLSLKGSAPTEKELNAARKNGAQSGCK